MTPELWVAVAVVTIPAVAAMVVSLLNRGRLGQLHVEINSRISELIAANARANHAEGVAVGSADAQAIKGMVSEAIAEAVAQAKLERGAVMAQLALGISDRMTELTRDAPPDDPVTMTFG